MFVEGLLGVKEKRTLSREWEGINSCRLLGVKESVVIKRLNLRIIYQNFAFNNNTVTFRKIWPVGTYLCVFI